MTTIAIGDIHGCMTALESLFERIAPAATDRLVFLGDYVDRGPRSRDVLDFVIELKRRQPVIALRGNHEWMMCEARYKLNHFEMWLAVGGLETLQSYGADATLADVPDHHWDFLDNALHAYYEIERDFFLHASYAPTLAISDQPLSESLWQRITAELAPHVSNKRAVLGHTRQHEQPYDLGYAVCIDTGAYAGGWLTALDIETNRYWQANELGQTREGALATR
jgi:serine/threonine protein phosphatase 1